MEGAAKMIKFTATEPKVNTSLDSFMLLHNQSLRISLNQDHENSFQDGIYLQTEKPSSSKEMIFIQDEKPTIGKDVQNERQALFIGQQPKEDQSKQLMTEFRSNES